jgi:uncharacterized protein YndB with AHSA1/START domain
VVSGGGGGYDRAGRDGRTTLTQTIRYHSRETRDAVLNSPMQRGMVASCDRLEKLLPSLGHEARTA